MSKVTSQDVSKMAGVDRSTVSRILNEAFEKHTYSPRTIKKVHAVAAELGYRPISSARTLKTGKTMLIGMIVSDIANPFFSQLVAHVETAALAGGYHLMVCNSNEDVSLQEDHLIELVSRGVDGILLSPSGPDGVGNVLAQDVPLVTIDRPLGEFNLPHVGLNHFAAGRMLGEQLKRRGYKNIGVAMPGEPGDPTLPQRLKGLQNGLGEGDKISWIIKAQTKDIRAEIHGAVRSKLENTIWPDAIAGLTNYSTIGAYEALVDCSVKVPGQVGIAGIDDFASATVVRPMITVVAQPLKEIARGATESLLELLGKNASDQVDDTETGRSDQNNKFLLAPELIERQSLKKSLGR